MEKPGLVVILGPTASGKSALAVALARRLRGEVVSADSRQVYRGLDIGTGKVTKREMGGIPHHLLDVASPRRPFSVAHYVLLARKAIKNILRRKKTPIVSGGTGHYIDALLGAQSIPDVPPDTALRAKLGKLPIEKLYAKLVKLDPVRAKTIDRHNPRRLVRALEIVLTTGRPVPPLPPKRHTNILQYIGMSSGRVVKIGIALSPAELRRRIATRLVSRMRQGMVAEAKRLRAHGLSFRRMEELGLEYRYLARLLEGRITREDFVEQLERAICDYAKRQMTWFKRDKDIVWVKNRKEALRLLGK